MKRHMPIFLTILSGIVFLFFGCQVIPSKPAEEPGKTDLSTSEIDKNIPTSTVTTASNNIDPLIVEFSGEYKIGGLMGEFLYLNLYPNGLFEYTYFNDIGPNGQISGELSIQNEHFILSPTVREGDSPAFVLFNSDHVDEEIIPIRWGDRRYLVPVDDITWFCNTVNLGWEPRYHEQGTVFLNLEDISKRIEELTEFPDEISWCILPKPITGLVTHLDDKRVTINLGSDQGIFKGMLLFVNSSQLCSVYIDSVNTTESVGQLDYSCDDIEVMVTRFSSRLDR